MVHHSICVANQVHDPIEFVQNGVVQLFKNNNNDQTCT